MTASELHEATTVRLLNLLLEIADELASRQSVSLKVNVNVQESDFS